MEIEAKPGSNEHLLRIRERQLAQQKHYWVEAAEKALEALPGASLSTHPAHTLWLRVQLAKAPPVEIGLSAQDA
jgi:hypothetical protein